MSKDLSSTKSVLINMLNVKSGGQLTYLINFLSQAAPLHHYHFTVLINNITNNRLNSLGVCIPDNISIYPVASKYAYGATSYIWQAFNLKNIVRQIKPDYIYAPTHIAYKVPHVKTILAMRNMAIPHFLKIDIPLKMRLNLFFKYFPLRYALRKADKVVAVSHHVKDFLKERIGKQEKDIFVAYHWVNELHRNDLSPIEGFDEIDKSDYIIFIPGSYYRYKKFHCLLDYLESTDLPAGAKVVFAGDEGDKKYLFKLIRYKARTYTPLFKTGLNTQQMKFLYKTAKLVILSSQVEACPNIAIEALANESTILATNIPPYREILGDFAIYFSITDKDDFIEKFKIALSSVPNRVVQSKQLGRINSGGLLALLSFFESD